MHRNYFILTAIMLALAFGTLFFQKHNKSQQVPPDKLLWDIIQPARYVSTDNVAKWIIEKDPSIELIDVRGAGEYKAFSLPNAINVPLDSLITPSGSEYFGIPGVRVVLFANDDILSDQAWVLLRRLGFKGNYVMKGGLNRWIETIIKPQKPPESDPKTAFELYEFRKGARLYFTGAKVSASSKVSKAKVVFKRRRKVTVASGGC